MLRRLMFFVRHCTLGMREAAFALRGWLFEWFYVLTTPIRAFRPRAWLGMLFIGVREVLAMFRLVRPREFSSEMVGGSWEVFGLGRLIINGIMATVVGFFWFLVWLPWYLARFFYYAPIRLWYFLRSRTWWQLTGIVTATAIIIGGPISVSYYLIREHRSAMRLSFLRRRFDGYLLYTNDLPKLEESLNSLVAALPQDPSVVRRLEMVRNREAQASEPDLVRFFMRYHMANGNAVASIREANKLLESFDEDWEARCGLARAALNRGDLAEAKKQVANLPHADAVAAPMLADVALNSAHLFKRIGDEARYDEMVDFVTTRLLPRLREPDVVNEPIPNKWFLINCYYLALAKLDKRPWLQKYWLQLEAASQSIMDDPGVDAPMLVQLGQAGQKVHLVLLETFRNQHLISNDEFNTMARDLLSRQKVLWDEGIRIDPKLPGGYVGLAELLFTVHAPTAAEECIEQGIRECGPVVDLVVAKAKLLRLIDPGRGLAFLERTVQPENMTVPLCEVFEQVAAQAGRPDKAIEACRLALKLDPKQDWARLREASHCLKLGRASEAVAALRPIEEDLVKYPEGCAEYVRALCDCGSYDLVNEFLETVTNEDCSVDVLLKTADGLQAAGRHADAVRWARRALDRDPRNVDVLMCVADNTRIMADRGENGWDVGLVRQALLAYRTVEQLVPAKPIADRAANNITWLELKALNLPQEAYISSARLRAIQDKVDTKAEYLETLGAVYIGVHQYEQAKEMLVQAVRTSGPRASFYTHLALAYYGLQQSKQAEWYLSKAATMPMTPHERADLREAVQIVRHQ